MKDMYCTNCGTELSDDANFCTQCGQKVDRSYDLSSDAKDIKEIKDDPINDKDQTPKKSPHISPPIIGVGIAVLSILIGMGAYAVFNRNGDDNPQKAAVSTQDIGEGSTKASSQDSSQKAKKNKDEKDSKEKMDFHIVESWKFDVGANYVTEMKEYTYDDEGRLLSVERNEYPYEEYEYNDDGTLAAEYHYKQEGVLENGKEYEYDPTGTYVVAYTVVGSWENVSVECEYDDAGNMIRENIWDQDGNPQGYIEHIYDEQNRELRFQRYREDGTPADYTEYEYESDGSYTEMEHSAVNFNERIITTNYDSSGEVVRREESYPGMNYISEVTENTLDDAGRYLSSVESTYNNKGELDKQVTEINEFNEQGKFSHCTVTVKTRNPDNYDEFVELTYNTYQEYDSYGNPISYKDDREEKGYELYRIYENGMGIRTGDDFDRRGISE